MASIINASSSGSGGIVQTADASGVLQLQSNGTVAMSFSGTTISAFGSINAGMESADNSIVSIGRADNTSVYRNHVLFYRGNKTGSGIGFGTYGDGANNAVTIAWSNTTYGDEGYLNQYGIGLGSGSTPASGIGIRFPATQSASSDANTLDDYEEGTWTPTWSVSGGTITTTAYSNGTYTKIGNTVYIRGYISYGGSVTGTPSGALALGGLPFTPGNGFGQSSTFAGGITALSLSFWVSNPPTYAQILPGSTTTGSIGYRTSTGGAATVYTDMDRGSSNYSQFVFQGQYTV